MKKMLFLMGTTALILGAVEARAETAQGDAQVEVVSLVTVTHNSGAKLNFGSVYAKADNVVTVSPAGVKTAGEAFGTPTADAFTVRGPSGAQVTVTLDNSASLTKTGDNTKVLTVTLTPSWSEPIELSGSDVNITVGGTLNGVSSDTTPGTYSGHYNVTYTY